MSDADADADGPGTASFESEALPHLDAVYRFALRLAGSPDAAEDLVQETFLRAFRAWHQYTPGTNAKSWLFTICRNVFLRQRERGQRHDRILVSETAWDGVVNPLWLEPDLDPEDAFFHGIVDETILEAVDDLPEEFRTAVLLSDLEGLSYAEIGAVMKVPVGTVKSRIFRGRRHLQKRLRGYAEEAGFARRGGSEADRPDGPAPGSRREA